MSELKPCPFCGSFPMTHTFSDCSTPSVSCKTKNCLLSGGTWYPLERWNTRSQSDAELAIYRANDKSGVYAKRSREED